MLPADTRMAASSAAPLFAMLFSGLIGLGLASGPAHASVDSASAIPGISSLDSDSASKAAAVAAGLAYMDSIEKKLTYRTGEIRLDGDLAVARLPPGFRYLDPDQSAMVLTELWGNPPGGSTLGMIFPPGQSPLLEDGWAVILSFDEDGYVKDDDADRIKYDELLEDMQKDSREANKERVKMDYDPIEIVGWAEKPSYDKATNKLYWAKEIRFGESPVHTLNYNIRVLGRRGVLVLNAVASMPALATVKEGMKTIQGAVEFNQGHRYAEFDPKLDKVATYGIAGLVAGTLLAKGGMLKVLIAAIIAGKKFLIIGLGALGFGLARFFKKPAEKKEFKEEVKEV